MSNAPPPRYPIVVLDPGLHGFNDFSLIDCPNAISPTHCTQYIEEIERRYPDAYQAASAGRVVSFNDR